MFWIDLDIALETELGAGFTVRWGLARSCAADAHEVHIPQTLNDRYARSRGQHTHHLT